jgi:hypothetical protein
MSAVSGAAATEASAFSCPRCAAGLSRVSASALLNCPACASALAVYVPGQSIRESIVPAKGPREALAASAEFWARPEIPEKFATAVPEAPVLLFAAVGEAHWVEISGKHGAGVAVERHQVALAAPIPGVPVDKADLPGALAKGRRIAFDSVALQKTGHVFDPVTAPAQLFSAAGQGSAAAQRMGVVYVPFWLVRKRFRLGLYEALVDAGSGRVLHARAPLARTRLLFESAAIVYFLAALVAMPPTGWGHIASALLNLNEVGVGLLLLIPAGLLLVAAWAWDRLRFRYEVIGDSSAVKNVPINRPEATLLVRAAKKAAEVAMWILSKVL